jgi:hypothetical protein
MVREHSAELVTDPELVRVIEGDLRDPDSVLGNSELRSLIDFSEPAGLLMTAVVHFVSDGSDPDRLLGVYESTLAPGSYLALSHLTSDLMPDRSVSAFHRLFERGTEQIHFRTRQEIADFFAGLELVPPSDRESAGRLCYAGDWGAEDPVLADSDGSRWLYCGVARIPAGAGTSARSGPLAH